MSPLPPVHLIRSRTVLWHSDSIVDVKKALECLAKAAPGKSQMVCTLSHAVLMQLTKYHRNFAVWKHKNSNF
jgi:hypothetical protein